MGYERQNFLNKQKLYAEQLNHMEDGILLNEASIEALTTFVNDILDSDDETLNELSEIVAYIKDNKTTINAILNDKVNVTDIVNTLTSDATNKPLSAAQGKALNTLITALQTAVNGKAPTNHKSTATTYGTGDETNYGHVKLSDATDGTSGASGGVAATPAAVKAAYDLAKDKANSADIATTILVGTAVQNNTYWKIADFGNWGTGDWTKKGFSMLITSRAGEMVWVSLAANDSGTSAGAIRLINRYSKIGAIHYSVSESAIYVTAVGWANNICAHILSNVNGDYVPTIASASALPSDAVAINIVEFGIDSTSTIVGDNSVLLALGGSATRPTYNGNDVALYSDVSALSSEITNKLNRSTAVNAADTNYTTLMARGMSLNSADTTPAVNGAVAWTYK